MRKKLILASLAVFLLLLNCLSPLFAASSLEKDITQNAKTFSGRTGIYAKNLKNGRSYAYQADLVFPTASTSKLVVALAVYKYLYPVTAPDDRDLYDSAVEQMITVSDNASFYNLLDSLAQNRPDALGKVTSDLRLVKTKIHDDSAFRRYSYHSVTTPAEMAKVMETINAEKYLSKGKSTLLKNELANTIFHDEIPRFMLTKVMHKVGELDNVLADVGIVDDGKDQILISIYTDTENSTQYASDFIANMSAKLYNHLRRK